MPNLKNIIEIQNPDPESKKLIRWMEKMVGKDKWKRWRDRGMDEWMDGWMDGWMRIEIHIKYVVRDPDLGDNLKYMPHPGIQKLY